MTAGRRLTLEEYRALPRPERHGAILEGRAPTVVEARFELSREGFRSLRRVEEPGAAARPGRLRPNPR